MKRGLEPRASGSSTIMQLVTLVSLMLAVQACSKNCNWPRLGSIDHVPCVKLTSDGPSDTLNTLLDCVTLYFKVDAIITKPRNDFLFAKCCVCAQGVRFVAFNTNY